MSSATVFDTRDNQSYDTGKGSSLSLPIMVFWGKMVRCHAEGAPFSLLLML